MGGQLSCVLTADHCFVGWGPEGSVLTANSCFGMHARPILPLCTSVLGLADRHWRCWSVHDVAAHLASDLCLFLTP